MKDGRMNARPDRILVRSRGLNLRLGSVSVAFFIGSLISYGVYLSGTDKAHDAAQQSVSFGFSICRHQRLAFPPDTVVYCLKIYPTGGQEPPVGQCFPQLVRYCFDLGVR